LKNAQLKGMISFVIALHSRNSLTHISELINHAESKALNYEVIVIYARGVKQFERGLSQFCSDYPNTTFLQIAYGDIDNLLTTGIDQAVGEWIFELPDTVNCVEIVTIGLDFLSNLESHCDSLLILDSKPPILDSILSKFASKALETKIYTLRNIPRISNRESLATWLNKRQKARVHRLAPHLDSDAFISKAALNPAASYQHESRLLAIGLRNIFYSTPKPLRWFTYLSLISSTFSLMISIVILSIGIFKKTVPGWTSTNLQLSITSFLLFLGLGIISEYTYQLLLSVNHDQGRIIQKEISSTRYTFKEQADVQSEQ
jgi:hypothetical protein